MVETMKNMIRVLVLVLAILSLSSYACADVPASAVFVKMATGDPPAPASSDNPFPTAGVAITDPNNSTITPLLGSGSAPNNVYTGEWTETLDPNYVAFIVTLKSDTQGDLYVERSANCVAVGQTALYANIVELNVGQRFGDSPSARCIRLRFVNGVDAQTVMRLRLRLSTVPTGASYQQLKIPQNDETMALNTIAVVSGEKEDGTYGLVPLDDENHLMVNAEPSTYGIAAGEVDGHFTLNKFGNNDDTSTTAEIVSDLQQAIYPYLTATEALQVHSSDVDDQGLLQDSGTATGGGTTTLIDTAGDFINDGVAVGDLLINDTQGIHGSITARTATTITVFRLHDVGGESVDSDRVAYANVVGDVYRVANANDTGAAVVSVSGLTAPGGVWTLTSEHIILNGQTDVETVESFIRVFRSKVHLVGSSSGANEGNVITENNASTVPLMQITTGRGQTLMTQWTVPDGFKLFVNYWSNGESSLKGSEFVLLGRPFGETFQTKDVMHLSGTSENKPYDQPKIFSSRTDIEVRVTSGQAGASVDSGFGGWYEAN